MYSMTRYWTRERSQAAFCLAEGKSQMETAAILGITDRTIRNWLNDEEFQAEVDRLSMMVAAASRAQRMRWINRTVLNRINSDGSLQTEKDVIDLLKFAQSETTGAKIDLSKLAEILTGEQESQQGQGVSGNQGLLEAASGPAMDIQPEGIVEIVGPVTDEDVKQPE